MAATHSLDLERSSTQYATAPDANDLDFGTNNFTLECWIRLESIGIYGGLITKVDGSDLNGFGLTIENTNVITFKTSSNTASSTTTSNTIFTTGVWYHIAAVCSSSGTNFKIYVNGELDKDATVTARNVTGTVAMSIGQYRNADTTNLFDGLIRNVRVWNVARTQQEIRDNMNVDTPVTTNLIRSYILNNSYIDAMGIANLTASGSPVFSTTYPDAINLTENGAFTKKHKIVVQASQVPGSTDLTDVPIVLTESNFLSTVFDNTINGGADLRFSTDSEGKTRLAHEVVSWDTSGKTGEVWVKANTLGATTNTPIYVHYKNPTASAIDENEAFGKHQVWGENWEGVWHFNTSSIDSSKNSNDGTNTAITFGSDYGKIKSGATFNGSTSYINVGNGTSLQQTTFSYVFWLKPTRTSVNNTIIGSDVQDTPAVTFDASNKLRLVELNISDIGATNTVINTGEWTFATVTYDGTNWKWYLNGSLDNSGSNAKTFSFTSRFFGRYSTSSAIYYQGSLDNFGLYSGVLSADYITTLYNNQNSPSTFAIPQSTAGGAFLLQFV